MPRDALIPFAERRASERAAERASELGERTSEHPREGAFHLFTPISLLLSPRLPLSFHSTPLLCRKQQFTSFIRRHERMKNGGSRHHPLPSLSRPPAAVYDALHMRGHLLRVFGAGGRGRSFDWVTGVIHFDRADDDETEWLQRCGGGIFCALALEIPQIPAPCMRPAS